MKGAMREEEREIHTSCIKMQTYRYTAKSTSSHIAIEHFAASA